MDPIDAYLRGFRAIQSAINDAGVANLPEKHTELEEVALEALKGVSFPKAIATKLALTGSPDSRWVVERGEPHHYDAGPMEGWLVKVDSRLQVGSGYQMDMTVHYMYVLSTDGVLLEKSTGGNTPRRSTAAAWSKKVRGDWRRVKDPVLGLSRLCHERWGYPTE